MNEMQEIDHPIPWKLYALVVAEAWMAFCIATFSMAVYFSHLNSHAWTIIFAVLMGVGYLFVIGVCIRHLVRHLSIAALMLMVPIAPLAVLLLVVSLLPIIQKLL